MPQPLHVLIIEDSPTDARLIVRSLERGGYTTSVLRVDTAQDLEQALDQTTWDIIISDYALPGFSGLAALDIVHDRNLDVPFIIVSGTIGEETAVAAMKAGAHDYLMKGNLARLAPAVARELREALSRHQRREAEAHIQALSAQLQQSQKMEALGQLAGGIAHDFNNLLSIITSGAQLARATLPAEHIAISDIDDIIDASRRATDMTRQLLTFARRQNSVMQPININDVIEQITRLLRRLINSAVSIQIDLIEHPWLIWADPHQIEQVLINLIINASDAMPNGGILTISTAKIAAERVIEGWEQVAALGDVVRLQISDTGIGMSETVQQRIFEPFFTTKAPGKGTGLGLAVCYGIVQKHGGTIRVESTLGVGTTFIVDLPRSERINEPLMVDLEQPEQATVLVVEENTNRLQILRKAFEVAGFQIIEATNANEALGISRTFGGVIDLLVTNAVSQHGSGAVLAQTLIDTRPQLKILFLTDTAEQARIVRNHVGAGIALLSDPFTVGDLFRIAQEMLNSSSSPAFADIVGHQLPEA